MKKVLYYSIRLNRMYGPDVIAVTTERGGHWWGRELRNDLGTHGTRDNLRGRFETEAAAEAVLDKVARVRQHYQKQSALLSDAGTKLRRAENAKIEEVIDNLPKRDAAWLDVSLTLSQLEAPEDLRPTGLSPAT